jgi:hypothetical protein
MDNLEEKMKQAKEILQSWVDQQGHERCWYYPDVFNQLAELFEIIGGEKGLPPRCEFEKGCIKYQVEEYGKKDLV